MEERLCRRHTNCERSYVSVDVSNPLKLIYEELVHTLHTQRTLVDALTLM